MQKAHRFLLTGVFCAGLLLTSCGGSDSSSSVTVITESDMPYGSTMTVNKQYSNIPIQYDRRFIEEELVETIAKYYHALQENKTEDFAASLFQPYHQYELQILYKGLYTDEAIVDTSHRSLDEVYGTGWKFSMISVDEAVTEENISPDRDALANMLKDLASDEGIENFETDFDKLYEMEVSMYLEDQGSAPVGKSLMYGVHYQDKWYLIYNPSGGTEEAQ
ncbi:MAG: hypothetical protein IKI58_02775 [Oscillospiraceae bacterium]|nr:hypothetical protein [Oscillospiraceae bacterium]